MVNGTTGSSRPEPHPAGAPIVLVIGCGDLGMACARALGQRSPLVVVDLNEARLEAFVAELRLEGYAASAFVCDISNPDQVQRLGAFLGGVNGVRTLAHVAALGRDRSTPWRDMMNVNLIGANLVAQAVGPHMVSGGAAIFISSTGSYMTPTNARIEAVLSDPAHPDFHARLTEAFGREPLFQESYNLSKRGMNLMVHRLAVEWGARQVRVLTVSPGIVDTSMARSGGTDLPFRDENGQERMMTWAEMAAQNVALRRVGTILEVSSVVAFMASEGASFVNGIDIPVDGGWVAGRPTSGAASENRGG